MKKRLLLLISLASLSRAATYYVDNCMISGNDANAGTSQSAPWLTIARVNAAALMPGDSVLFRRNCIWHERLLPPTSGASGNPITFADYGTGNKPILDGATAPPHWGHGGGSYLLQDTFDSGAFSSAWSSTQGSIGTWAGFGITGPTGGGSAGAYLGSGQQCIWNGASTTEYWFETSVMSGSSAAARTYIGQFAAGSNTIVAIMFSSSTDPTPGRLRIFNYAAPAGSQESYGATQIAPSTWYKVKARLVISPTAGEIDIWLNTGSAWQLELAESQIVTGSSNVTRMTMGSAITSQSAYFDYFQVATGDPSLPSTTYLFTTPSTNALTPAPISLTRVWQGNSIQNITEYSQASGLGSNVGVGQWDITSANSGGSSVVWVSTQGAISSIEWPTIDYCVRIYGQSHLTFRNFVLMRALVRGMNSGTNGQASNVNISYCDFWDNNGSGFYVSKDNTIYGIDSYTLSHNTFYRNYLHAQSTVYQGGSGHGVYCTKCTNSLIEFNDCQYNGNYCVQLQDASNYNVYRYSRSLGEEGLLSLTTDKIGGSTGNLIYENLSTNEYQCVIATNASSNYFYNNTCAGFSYRGFANNSGTFGTLTNNIFWTTVPGAQVVFTDDGTGFASDYNIYGAQQPNCILSEGIYYQSLASWGGAGTHDMALDPLFVAPASGNVTLGASSPAHKGGTDLSAVVQYGWAPSSPWTFPPALINRSVLGNTDIGAYVFLPGGPGDLLGGNIQVGGHVNLK